MTRPFELVSAVRMATMGCVYALVDPRDGAIKYVGKTVLTAAARLVNHVSEAKSSAAGRRAMESRRKVAWICSILEDGNYPLAMVLEYAPVNELESLEQHYTASLVALGCPLVNLVRKSTASLAADLFCVHA